MTLMDFYVKSDYIEAINKFSFSTEATRSGLWLFIIYSEETWLDDDNNKSRNRFSSPGRHKYGFAKYLNISCQYFTEKNTQL